jgi:hypothetical protein
MTPPSIGRRTAVTTTDLNSLTLKTPGNPFSAKIYLVSRKKIAGPDTAAELRVGHGQRRLPQNRLLRPHKAPRNCLKKNLFHIPQSCRGFGCHHRFGVAQTRRPGNQTTRPNKPLKIFLHHQFMKYSQSGRRSEYHHRFGVAHR